MTDEIPETPQNNKSEELSLLKHILANFITMVTSLPGISSIAVILSMWFVYIYAGNSKEALGIASVDYARGMITLLFAVGTVVIALLLTLSAIFPTAASDEINAKERFERGKEVLSLLIGIFGTIIGFYFGSISERANQSDSSKTVLIDRESAISNPKQSNIESPKNVVKSSETPHQSDINSQQ